MEDLSFLPEVYERYFALRKEGVDQDTIAQRLDIPTEAMEAFIELAHAKLAHEHDLLS